MYHGMPKDVSPTHFPSKQTEPGLISLLAKIAIYTEKGKRYLVKRFKILPGNKNDLLVGSLRK